MCFGYSGLAVETKKKTDVSLFSEHTCKLIKLSHQGAFPLDIRRITKPPIKCSSMPLIHNKNLKISAYLNC